jgi:extracellular elastinolytic metalloproteinase
MRKSLPTGLAFLFLSFILVHQSYGQGTTDSTLLQLVKKHSVQLHVNADDLRGAVLSSGYTDQSTGISYLYLQQTYRDIKVYNSLITVAVKNNRIVYSSGKFIDSISNKAGDGKPSISASQAVMRTAAHLKLATPKSLKTVSDSFSTAKRITLSGDGIAKRNIIADLVWVSANEGKTVQLAWNVNIDVLHSADWWNVRVNALTGEVINKDNWTVHEQNPRGGRSRRQLDRHSFIFYDNKNETRSNTAFDNAAGNSFLPPAVTNAGYNVVPFPFESPDNAAPAIEHEPWLKAGPGNNATTLGWHYDGTNNYNNSRGNNVYAYEDLDDNNLPGSSATSATAFPSLSFNFTPDFSQQPYFNSGSNSNLGLGITNLFYWNNLAHDVAYQYGFTEAVGNFQNDNQGRGGLAGDYVRAEAIDGSGRDNANFTTPVDGFGGRMQMYVFNNGAPLTVNTPSAIAGTNTSVESDFGFSNTLLTLGPKTGQVVYYNDATGHNACNAATNAVALAGKIALIDESFGCDYRLQVKHAQDAGAIAVIGIYADATGPYPMYADNSNLNSTITVPSVTVSQSQGAVLAAQLGNNLNVTLSTGIYRDGSLDNGVVTHEYMHGVTNRLTGGPANSSCLFNNEAASEGWSDYFALMMTTNWATANASTGAAPRPMATYAFDDPAGLRRNPYCTNLAVDPITYADMASSGETHDIGEIWCSTIWDMTWNIIQQEGSINPNIYDAGGGGGNTIALRLVMEGVKLQTCNPGFLDSRNAILAADSIYYNNAHKCAIWNAFARRGMGVSAIQGSVWNTFDQTAAFDVPSGVNLTRSSTPASIPTGNQVTYTLSASCNCQAPVSNFNLRDTIPTGFSYVSSTGGTVSGNIVTVPVSFSTPLEKKNYSVTLQANTGACATSTAINDDRDTHTAGGLTPTVLNFSETWTTVNSNAHSGSNAWHGNDANASSDFVLTSAAFTPGNLAVLSFWHSLYLENEFDGGKIELSTNAGSSWQDAGGYIIQNGYNTLMDVQSRWGAVKAFSGLSNGYMNTILDLSSFAGQSLQIRFHIKTDAFNIGNGAGLFNGWYVDDISQVNGCGGLVRAGLYNNSNQLVTNSFMPVFVTPSIPLPLILLGFTAEAEGNQVVLRWQTTSEVNTKEFRIEHSIDGQNWKEIGTVPAKGQGSGDYTMHHAGPATGDNFYRLRSIDLDARYSYSPVRKVHFSPPDGNGVLLLPNPAYNQTTVSFTKILTEAEITLHDGNGRLVQRYRPAGSINRFILPTDKLAAGTYLITVRSGTLVMYHKLIVIR